MNTMVKRKPEEMLKLLKPGMKVRIKDMPELKKGAEMHYGFSEEMGKMAGKVVTIKQLGRDEDFLRVYFEETQFMWNQYTFDLLEGKMDEEYIVNMRL